MKLTAPVDRLTAEDRGRMGPLLMSAVFGHADDPFGIANPLTPEQWQSAAESFLHSFWCAELSVSVFGKDQP